MPTSATGRSTERVQARRTSGGFSLLELLVVVTIIGIFAGAAVLYVGVTGRDRVIEREMRRLGSLIELLREEALMQSRDYGLLFSRSGYRFYIYDHVQQLWVEPPNDRLLREHELPEPLRLTLLLEDREVRLEPEFDARMRAEPEPQVFLLSSGELTPFRVEIGRDLEPARFTLTAELDGELEIASPDAETF